VGALLNRFGLTEDADRDAGQEQEEPKTTESVVHPHT
jgi:hypothetical protein